MVNWVKAVEPLVHLLVKMSGLRRITVEIDQATETVMTFWVPKHKPGKYRPAVVLVHGFAADGLTTWQLQMGSLARDYDVYVPDLLFFGGSATSSGNRSPDFQASCLAAALGKLGVQQCAVVGFSYGGVVAFRLAEARPDLVRSLVVSGSAVAVTEAVGREALAPLGFRSSSELLLPESVEGLKKLLAVATYKKLWFPDCMHRGFLEVMFNNRKARAELLEALVVSKNGASVPVLPQKVLLLWGEHDNIFNIHLATNMKEQLGGNAILQSISKAGHLAHIERPCVYNCCVKEFLALVYSEQGICTT